MPRRNASRARRRNADRARRNALALAVAVETDEAPKRTYSRHKSQLELLEARGSISRAQRQAGDRLLRDFIGSNSQVGRVTLDWSALGMPRPGGSFTQRADSAGAIAARERFEQAMAALGRWLAPVVMHVCITDLPVAEWGPLNGHAKTEGAPLLRLGLDCLCHHYRADRAEAA